MDQTWLIFSDAAQAPPGAAIVGGKAAALFRLLDAGLLVPPFVALSTACFRAAVADQRRLIEELLHAADPNDGAALQAISEEIRTRICACDSINGFDEALTAAAEDLATGGGLLSVRSSVVGEDATEHSFAGLMRSYMNVQPEAVGEVVRNVWASAFSPAALAYRHRMSLSTANIDTGVILQRMVQPLASGVLFTRCPETGRAETVIAAGFGLGEGVVANAVESDTYRLRRGSRHISKEVARKTMAVALDEGAAAGSRMQLVAADRQLLPALTDAQIAVVAELGGRAEDTFGSPQDVEWAIDEIGRVFVLQSRPLTFPALPPAGQLRIWDNSNIVESYPGLTLPLTFSFIRTAYEEIFRRATRGFVVLKAPLRGRERLFANMLGLLHGRVYYNLLNWYEMLSFLPGFQAHRASWDQMIGISLPVPFPETKLAPANALLTALVAAARLLSVRGNAQSFFRAFASVYHRHRGFDHRAASEQELVEYYHSLTGETGEIWHRTLYNDFATMTFFGWLKSLSERWIGDPHASIHNDLLCGAQRVESVAPAESLLEIVRDPSLQELLSLGDDDLVWRMIYDEPTHASLRDRIVAHITEYGDRSLEELKLERPSLREEPWLIVPLLRRFSKSRETLGELRGRELDIRRGAEEVVRLKLRGPWQRLVFDVVLRNARLAVASRENMRFARARLYGLIRAVFVALGERLAEQDVVETAADIFYLSIEEVFSYLDGTTITLDLRALVALRRREYVMHAATQPPDRLVTSGIPYLNPLTAGDEAPHGDRLIRGTGCSGGIISGAAAVVRDPAAVNGTEGAILVARATDPAWIFLMLTAQGLVTEKGSLLSHTAIIGRELGIPTVTGATDATSRIADGAFVTMNGQTGVVQWE